MVVSFSDPARPGALLFRRLPDRFLEEPFRARRHVRGGGLVSPFDVRLVGADVAGPAIRQAGGDHEPIGPRPLRVALELEHRLLDAGYDVIGIAATAEDALAKARSGKPDLAVMDIRLASPRDGIAAATDLLGLGIPSIFATAHADPETRRRGEEARPLGWLQKPYSPESVIALIRQALAKRN
jgi:CheY-like chemotaxis protein